MSGGKRLTLDEVFARRAAEVRAELARQEAYEATPEGAAERAEREAHHARMRAADERFAADNPPDRFQEGKDAALADEPRHAPDDLTDDEADAWLAGYDTEGESTL